MWQPVSRDVTTYVASSGRVSATLNQQWQTSSSLWVNTSKTNFTYNPGNQVTQQLTQVWDISTSSWDNSTQSTSTYNSNNLLDSVLSQTWLTGAWQNSDLTVDSYNAGNLQDSVLSQTWQWTDTFWSAVSSSQFSYYANKSIESIVVQSGLNRTIYSFDTLNRETSIESLTWKGYLLGHWYLTTSEEFAYNSVNDLVSLTNWQFTPTRCPPPPISPPGSVCYTKTFVGQTTYIYVYNGDGTKAQIITNRVSDTTKTAFHYAASCLLPLTLLNFTAALNGKAAQLQWTTATEINTKNFIIQRSIDAIHFQNIGSVNAVGNSTQITPYNFADAGVFNAGANKLFYRLQMVDKDGKFTYSNIAIVQIANEKRLVIYPNPVNDELLITSNTLLNNSQIRIFDPGGRVVYQRQISNTPSGTTKIDVSDFAKGVYYLQLITGSDVQTTKFVKY
jgi:hypothetical protein